MFYSDITVYFIILTTAVTLDVAGTYGRTIQKWTAKARSEVEDGRASLVLGLVPARTDTRWWHVGVAGHADIWLLKGRLAFGDGRQSAPFPSAIVLWSADRRFSERTAFEFPRRVDRHSRISLSNPWRLLSLQVSHT